MLSAALAIANAVQFSVCSGVLRVLGLAGAGPSDIVLCEPWFFWFCGRENSLIWLFWRRLRLAGSWGLGRLEEMLRGWLKQRSETIFDW